jgi:hypothetical protein
MLDQLLERDKNALLNELLDQHRVSCQALDCLGRRDGDSVKA